MLPLTNLLPMTLFLCCNSNTLMIFSSDNGGPADHANNWPLRGSKGSGNSSRSSRKKTAQTELSDMLVGSHIVTTPLTHTVRVRLRCSFYKILRVEPGMTYELGF